MLGRKNHLSLVIFHFSFAQVEVTSRKPLVDRKLLIRFAVTCARDTSCNLAMRPRKSRAGQVQYRERSDRMPHPIHFILNIAS